MKKFYILLLILSIGTPLFADVINPNIPQEQYRKMRMDKRVYNQRTSLLKRVCGESLLTDKKSCKAQLKKEMKEMEKMINEY